MPSRAIYQVIEERPFVCVPSHMTVQEVTRRMAALHESAALISEHGVLVGIFTERDATFRVLAAGLDPARTTVGEVLTHHPQSIRDDKPFGHALHMMYEGGFRHVPVVTRDNRPLGVVTARDALGIDAISLGEELVRREEITVIL
ncbi:CBS domain-containing protein [Pseudothauera rhizosphaerae]|uniref:CBS domain-containing protein n=1 Tax=Pseudothauera rhizosphaerae TaxID=2565932 RepID=A0A4V3WAR5_9RHOO|nr:CBS domain-containing protein [Pseudothauera rhizosphaerae]THF60291.1 CBS domain-containing protein [Pseudothauera rhizosphaerae]